MDTERHRGAGTPATRFGGALRDWRRARGQSQLALAVESGVSQRHISFLESGRAQPSRDMVIRLATVLDVPLREQNVLLAAAGFSGVYAESPLDGPEMKAIRKAIDHLLGRHEPYPAVVADRNWNLVVANGGAERLLGWLLRPRGVQPELAPDGKINLLRLLLHPEGFRPFVTNWQEVASWLLESVRREATADGQSDAGSRLVRGLLADPSILRTWQAPHREAPHAPALAVELCRDDLGLCFFTTITTLGTPYDITAQELRIECFFPADEATERDIEKLNAF